ncbi:MAG: phytoene/squalene synthase family protein [Spirochaetales bacterium]|nr:phytoene/squalene synthase family protein [Spirochaetales bacterium]
MAITTIHYKTFKRGSKTYFNSSLFFPPAVREDVFILYGFVRIADDFVDNIPQDSDGFSRFKDQYYQCLKGRKSGEIIIDDFVELMKRKAFDPSWIDAFLQSMEWDLTKSVYTTLEETLLYIYGSAEVIGLFMSRILDLPEKAFHAARMQGRAMQYINFIRDIAEDNALGRRYLPLEDSGLSSLNENHVRAHTSRFIAFHRKQIDRYESWQKEAEKGYRYIPRRYLIPIKTAADMYLWSADKIRKDPLIVYKKKVKPPKWRILLQLLKNMVEQPG